MRRGWDNKDRKREDWTASIVAFILVVVLIFLIFAIYSLLEGRV